jgi:hypothetical protein
LFCKKTLIVSSICLRQEQTRSNPGTQSHGSAACGRPVRRREYMRAESYLRSQAERQRASSCLVPGPSTAKCRIAHHVFSSFQRFPFQSLSCFFIDPCFISFLRMFLNIEESDGTIRLASWKISGFRLDLSILQERFMRFHCDRNVKEIMDLPRFS